MNFGKNTKAQASIELVLLLAVMLLLVQTIIIPSFMIAESSAKDVSNLAIARSEIQKVTNAVELVDSSGAGAKQTLHIAVPARTVISCWHSVAVMPRGYCIGIIGGGCTVDELCNTLSECVFPSSNCIQPMDPNDPSVPISSCTVPTPCNNVEKCTDGSKRIVGVDGDDVLLPPSFKPEINFNYYLFGEPPEICKYDSKGFFMGDQPFYQANPFCQGYVVVRTSSDFRCLDFLGANRTDMNFMNYYTVTVLKDPVSGEVQLSFA